MTRVSGNTFSVDVHSGKWARFVKLEWTAADATIRRRSRCPGGLV